MKKALILTIALFVILSGSAFAQAPFGNPNNAVLNTQVQIDPGTSSIALDNNNLDFGTVTLGGTTQVVSVPFPSITVHDYRGLGTGYSVQVMATDLTVNGKTIDAPTMDAHENSVRPEFGGPAESTGWTFYNGNNIPIIANTPLYQANNGYGTGAYRYETDANDTLNLSVPPTTLTDPAPYTGTVVFTLFSL